MTFNTFISFWSISILFVITPGVDWSYAISAGIKNKVLPAVFGLLSGHFIATLVVATGVGTIVVNHPSILVGVTVIGALYLLWVGIQLLLSSSKNLDIKTISVDKKPSWMWFFNGLGISGLNPKVFLLFLALLPQFINPALSLSITAQILFLGLVHIFNCLVVYVLVGFSAKKVLAKSPGKIKIVNNISGVFMILISISLIFNQF